MPPRFLMHMLFAKQNSSLRLRFSYCTVFHT